MTAPDTNAIRAQMEALTGFTAGPWRDEDGVIQSQTTVWQNGVKQVGWDYATIRAEVTDDWDQAANARLIAAAPDMHATILALCAEVERLTAALADERRHADALTEAVTTLIEGGNRQLALISRKVRVTDPMTLTVTKGQFLAAIEARTAHRARRQG